MLNVDKKTLAKIHRLIEHLFESARINFYLEHKDEQYREFDEWGCDEVNVE